MAQRVFVHVVGFTDDERHALNLLFRISEEHETVFSLWDPQAPEAPRLAIIDGSIHEGQVEATSALTAATPMVWVGPAAPEGAWRVFQRPIAWPEVVKAMDELFPPPLDFDLEFDEGDTQPPVGTDIPQRPRRVLIASAHLDERLYLRAKLSLVGLTQADDAENAAQALELARLNDYALALVDFRLPGASGWPFLRELAQGPRPIRKVIVTAAQPSWLERMRAWFAPVTGFFAKPPHPAKLHNLLERV